MDELKFPKWAEKYPTIKAAFFAKVADGTEWKHPEYRAAVAKRGAHFKRAALEKQAQDWGYR